MLLFSDNHHWGSFSHPPFFSPLVDCSELEPSNTVVPVWPWYWLKCAINMKTFELFGEVRSGAPVRAHGKVCCTVLPPHSSSSAQQVTAVLPPSRFLCMPYSSYPLLCFHMECPGIVYELIVLLCFPLQDMLFSVWNVNTAWQQKRAPKVLVPCSLLLMLGSPALLPKAWERSQRPLLPHRPKGAFC